MKEILILPLLFLSSFSILYSAQSSNSFLEGTYRQDPNRLEVPRNMFSTPTEREDREQKRNGNPKTDQASSSAETTNPSFDITLLHFPSRTDSKGKTKETRKFLLKEVIDGTTYRVQLLYKITDEIKAEVTRCSHVEGKGDACKSYVSPEGSACLSCVQYLKSLEDELTLPNVHRHSPAMKLLQRGSFIEIPLHIQRITARTGKNVSSGVTTLHMAAFIKDNTTTVKKLLDLGADPTAKDVYGRTVLHCACSTGGAEMVALLKEAIATKKYRNSAKQYIRRE